MKKRNIRLAHLVGLAVVPPIIGITLGITVAEQFKKTDYYKEHITTTTVVTTAVENCVENVENFTTTEEVRKYTHEQLEILALIIYQEAGGDRYSTEARKMVGSVFLNRVNSPLFPNTFKEVATQNGQYGTLYKTGIKWPDRAVKQEEAHAVERAYFVAEELLITGSILPKEVVWQAEFKQGKGVYKHLDDIYFCY